MKANLDLPSGIPEGFLRTDSKGLSAEEATRRAAAGEINRAPDNPEKSTLTILRHNLFTFFNLLNLLLALCLLLVGSYRNMLFVLIVISNTLIGTVQELRARNTIRQLTLLNAPEVHVLRDGLEQTLKPEEIVRGDLMVLRAGDQVTVDALVLNGEGCTMEALLTGESTPIPKHTEDWLYSGSYMTEGKVYAQAVCIGEESYLGRLTKEAKGESRPESALMKNLDRLIRFDTCILIPLGILLFLKQYLLGHTPLADAVPSAVAAMIGMIPEGLMLLTSIAMAAGVVKLGLHRTLVQELSGIETLARVDVLCLDKTGTLTTGAMTPDTPEPVDADESELRTALSRYLANFDEKTGTLDALRTLVPAGNEKGIAILPFSSERKKSAVSFSNGTTLILGAPDFVLGEQFPETLRNRTERLTEEGHRVLLLAEAEGCISGEKLPPVTRILGLLSLTDELRPNAPETLQYFHRQDVTVKIISGDNPRTVSRIARQAGLDGWERRVDAGTLKDDAALEAACEQYTVFGRVTPAQKKQLVLMLKKHGHSVGMTGDGVNDIPALKSADCSIAMAGGADAARHAAQLTLLDSDFGVMPTIVLEGRRVINNMTRAASLFLTKTVFSLCLSLLALILPFAYPFQPIQMTLVSSLTVGIPSFLLAFEPSSERIRGRFLYTVLMRALPGGIAVAVCSAVSMLLGPKLGLSGELCSTIATWIAGTVGLIVLYRSCRPFNRVRIAIFALMTLGFICAVSFAGSLFYLVPFNSTAWLLYVGLALLSLLLTVGPDFIRRHKTAGQETV